MRISSVFSYYGGKSKIVNCYPAPIHDLIIEPFAGAAAYAWRWRDRDVWINDLDPRTYSIWAFLTSPNALELVRRFVPPTIAAGTRITELVPEWVPDGLVELMRAEANQGTQGSRGVHNQVTPMGAKCWPRLRVKMEEVIPAIRHWKVTALPYTALPDDIIATWFIDPPYSNAAGRRYRQSRIDYEHLASWCLTRNGQTIVCENAGATWLPFEPLDHRRVSIRSRYQKADAKEVLFTRTNYVLESAQYQF